MVCIYTNINTGYPKIGIYHHAFHPFSAPDLPDLPDLPDPPRCVADQRATQHLLFVHVLHHVLQVVDHRSQVVLNMGHEGRSERIRMKSSPVLSTSMAKKHIIHIHMQIQMQIHIYIHIYIYICILCYILFHYIMFYYIKLKSVTRG